MGWGIKAEVKQHGQSKCHVLYALENMSFSLLHFACSVNWLVPTKYQTIMEWDALLVPTNNIILVWDGLTGTYKK